MYTKVSLLQLIKASERTSKKKKKEKRVIRKLMEMGALNMK